MADFEPASLIRQVDDDSVSGASSIESYFPDGVSGLHKVRIPKGTVNSNSLYTASVNVIGKSTTAMLLGDELHPNPSFETGTSFWFVSGATLERSTAQARDGAASGLITPDATGEVTTSLFNSQAIAVAEGTGYALSMWLYAPDLLDGVELRALWLDADRNFLSADTYPAGTLTAGVWTEARFIAAAPSSGAYLVPGVRITGTPTASDLLYIDDVSTRAITVPTVWLSMRWWHEDGTFVDGEPSSQTVVVQESPIRISQTVVSPSWAMQGQPLVWSNHPGDIVLDGAMLTEGDRLLDYFDGDTPDNDQFAYEWTGVPHDSSSVNVLTEGRPRYARVRVLTDEDGEGRCGDAVTYVRDLIVGRTYTASAYVSLGPRCPDVEISSSLSGVEGDPVRGTTYRMTWPVDGTPWRRINVTFVATRAEHRIAVSATQPAPAGGSMFLLSNVLVEESAGPGTYFDGSSGPDYLWEQGAPEHLGRSYFYQDRLQRTYILDRLLDEHSPMGITPARPEFALPPRR